MTGGDLAGVGVDVVPGAAAGPKLATLDDDAFEDGVGGVERGACVVEQLQAEAGLTGPADVDLAFVADDDHVAVSGVAAPAVEDDDVALVDGGAHAVADDLQSGEVSASGDALLDRQGLAGGLPGPVLTGVGRHLDDGDGDAADVGDGGGRGGTPDQLSERHVESLREAHESVVRGVERLTALYL